MRLLRRSLPAILFLTFALRARATEPVLSIVMPEKTLTFTAAEFAALPRTELKLAEPREKQERTYAGVAVRELLTRAGAPLGEKLRGPAHLTGVIVRCKDNYAVLFALAEFDENFSPRTILLADREDGEILPPSAAAPACAPRICPNTNAHRSTTRARRPTMRSPGCCRGSPAAK